MPSQKKRASDTTPDLDDERHSFYLQLRICIISEFEEYGRSTDENLADLLSNVLAGMEDVFRDRSQKWCS